MKLIELADEHNLDEELLQEVVEEDLSIPLPKGMDTDLEVEVVSRILSCDGLETKDGAPFTPIIAEEFIERHKRSLAAKKGAATRKAKLEEEARRKADEERERLEEERRKHEEELRRREEERERLEAEEQAAKERIEAEERQRLEAEEAERQQALDDLRRREEEARRLANELQRLKQQEAELTAMIEGQPTDDAETTGDATQGEAADPAATATAEEVLDDPAPETADVETAPTDATDDAAPAVADTAAPDVDEATTDSETKPAKREAEADAEADAGNADSAGKSKKKLGSKLASLAKATHVAADHSSKVQPAKNEVDNAINDSSLTPEDRRRLIQDNIRRNLAMAKKVNEARTTQRRGRKQGFQTIDRSKGGGPGGRGGPGGPNRGGPPAPGRGPRRDSRDHRSEKNFADSDSSKAGRRRRLSTEEEDLSGKTEFEVALPCTVREFCEASGLKSNVVIAKLFMAGLAANINSTLEKDAIELLAAEFQKEVTIKEAADVEDSVLAEHQEEDDPTDMAPRPPVVTVLGHVDHGKTSLLDAIRKTDVTAGESGGITQHIGAYTVETEAGQAVTFIDTPGHEAFTEMRARGAQVTDIAVIVVAADDGIMPQTVEAINHAKAAEVPIIIAMNKVDRDNADPEKVLRQLAEQELLPEDWGGQTAVVRTSAITGQGVDELLERLGLEAEVLELSANHFAKASGTVLEAHRHEGQGVTATLLVQRGTLARGDVILAGTGYGRVRSLIDWHGAQTEIAGPSTAVEVTGLSELPKAGDHFHSLENLKQAAEAAEQRQHQLRERELREKSKVTTMATLFGDLEEAKRKELKLIIKADTSGTLEVLKKALNDLSTDEVRVNMLHTGVGGITTGDVTLAEASQAILIGFHVIAEAKARRQADSAKIEIRTYTIIYEMVDEVRRALSGLLDPEEVESVIGHAEVRNTFKSSKVGTIAGLYVTDGIVQRDCFMRITRDSTIIHTGKVDTLRRFKDDVKEVRDGYECGLTVEKFDDIQIGDLFEFFTRKQVMRSLEG